MAGIVSRLIASREERVSLESAAPFVLTHPEKRLVFALGAPLDPQTIDDIEQLVTAGLILGFVVKDEIALGGEVGVINNVAEEGFENTNSRCQATRRFCTSKMNQLSIVSFFHLKRFGKCSSSSGFPMPDIVIHVVYWEKCGRHQMRMLRLQHAYLLRARRGLLEVLPLS